MPPRPSRTILGPGTPLFPDIPATKKTVASLLSRYPAGPQAYQDSRLESHALNRQDPLVDAYLDPKELPR